MNIVGPSRLILLRAGKYDYGEVELINPLHLVGPNNIGKTSLIAVLQFLYIDDQRSMHFSREMAETRKYYFPDQNSYLLFECLTPAGYHVVGVQGLGPIRAYEFQRFAYQGQYDPDDFLDEERRVRDPEEVRTRLAARDFRLLEPRHLRAALTGIGDNRGVNLGLVPIRQRDHYERFRAVFGNLLRLAHLRQDELKQFLLEIHRTEFQQGAIDLEAGYSNQYRKVCEEAEGLRELRAIVEDVRLVLELAAKRDDLQRLLPGLWEAVRTEYGRTESELVQRKQKKEEHLARLGEEGGRLAGEENKCKAERDGLLQELGKINGELERHEQDQALFRDFLVDFEKSRRNELEHKIDRLGASLGQAVDVSVEQVRRRVGKVERELAGMRRRLDLFSRNVAAKLLPMLSDPDADQMFRLLNPEILGLSRVEGLVIKDEQKFAVALDRFAGRIKGEVYEDDLTRVLLAELTPPDLAAYRDAATLEQRIAEQEELLQRELRILEAAVNSEQIRREKEQLRQECNQINDRLRRYQEYQERMPFILQRTKEKNAVEKRKEQLEKQLTELVVRRIAITEEKRGLEERRRELESRREKLLRRLQKLAPPDSSWPIEPYVPESEQLDTLLELYERKQGEHMEIVHQFDKEFRRIEQRTYGKYLGEDQAETLANLQAEVEALDEREKAVQELWKSLAAGLQSAFKGLYRDLQTLASRIDELNRRLGRVSISNLSRLRLILREHAEWTRRIRTLVEVEAIPLFFDNNAVNEAQNQLGELLKQNPGRVELRDLFDLHFEVTSPDRQSRRYPHLDSIESNGTTITIKVLINLILLKGLLGDKEVSVPFYLDEASSLDRENLTAIVQEARKMGFVAVLASPEAMEAADSLYFLRESNGRIFLDPKTSLLRIERRSGDGG